jgi:hypothetical protein
MTEVDTQAQESPQTAADAFNNYDPAWIGPRTILNGYSALKHLLSVLANPTLAQATMDALQARADYLEKGEAKLAADTQAAQTKLASDRAAFETECASTRARYERAAESSRQTLAKAEQVLRQNQAKVDAAAKVLERYRGYWSHRFHVAGIASIAHIPILTLTIPIPTRRLPIRTMSPPPRSRLNSIGKTITATSLAAR